MSDTAVAGVVLINVFTVERDNQQRLVDLLAGATDGFVNRAPGFLNGKATNTIRQCASTQARSRFSMRPSHSPRSSRACTRLSNVELSLRPRDENNLPVLHRPPP